MHGWQHLKLRNRMIRHMMARSSCHKAPAAFFRLGVSSSACINGVASTAGGSGEREMDNTYSGAHGPIMA